MAQDDPNATDWFSQAMSTQPVAQTGGSMQQVATAPDGVPVYSSGGQFFTRNADGTMTQQFQGGLPDWLQQATGGQPPGGQTGPGPYTGNPQDKAAISAWFKQMGSMPGADPSLAANPDYWAGRAIETGGLNSGNSQYWQDASVGPKAFFNNPGRESVPGNTMANPQVGQAGQNFQNASQVGQYQAPAPYVPQTLQTPAAVNAQNVTAQTVGAPGQITPQSVQAQQVQGPNALTAPTLANPQGFQGVSQADLQADPGYQYRLQQAQQAVEQSAAAQGVARGSNTWKALMQQAADMASQQYQQTYANKFGEYQAQTANTLNYNQANAGNQAQAYGLTNQYQQAAQLANQGANLQAGTFNAGQNYNAQAQNIGNQMQTNQFNSGQNLQGQIANQGANLNAGQFNAGMNLNTQSANQANAANAYGMNATTGLNAYNANVSNALGQGQLGLGYQQAANSLALGQGQLGLGYANYGLNQQGQNYNQGLSTFQANQGAQQQAFNQNYSLAGLGLYANQQAGAAGQNYGNQAGQDYTGIGNAQAAGSMNQGTNWGGVAGNALNTGTQLYTLGQLYPQQQTQTTPYTLGY